MTGLLDWPVWGMLFYTLFMTHTTMATTTIYLHRYQAHGALELHPAVSHFCRAWLWLTTGIVTRVWVGIHRMHHTFCENQSDPHSPHIYGIWKVLLGGYWLYKKAEKKPDLTKYAKGVPDDAIERNLYSNYDTLGIWLMLGLNMVLFGVYGFFIWIIQMIWTPLMAAGVINGIGHYFGYRNFDTQDKSTNILPIGILIAGEELHNNHHAYPWSAKLSVRWYEFDIGWMYIRILMFFGLAKNCKTPPKIKFGKYHTSITINKCLAMRKHSLEVLRNYDDIMNRYNCLRFPKIEELRSRLKVILHDHHMNNYERKELLEKWFRDATLSGNTPLNKFTRMLLSIEA